MTRQESGNGPSRAPSWPVPPPLDRLQARAATAGPGDLDGVAFGLWQAARDTSGHVDREVTVRLLLAACHLLGRPAEDDASGRPLLQAALQAVQRAGESLRDRHPVDVDELLRIAWALTELESLPAGLELQHRGAHRGDGR